MMMLFDWIANRCWAKSRVAFIMACMVLVTTPSYGLSPFDLLMGGNESEEKNKDLGEVLDSDMFFLPTSEGESLAAAQIVVLDKRLGKPSSPLILAIGKEVQYEGMHLTLQRCWQEKEVRWDKDARALVKIRASDPENTTLDLWISSKFPGLTNMQSERFELLLQKCLASS